MSRRLTFLDCARKLLQGKARVLALALVPLAAVAAAIAQTRPMAPAKNHSHFEALEFNVEGGWAFKLPASSVGVYLPGGASAVATAKNNQMAPSAGVRLWFTPWLGLSADVVGINAGDAKAQVGSATSATSGYDLAGYLGGEAQWHWQWIRPYAHAGAGPFHGTTQLSTGGLSGQQQNITTSFTVLSFRGGGGVRLQRSPRWGLKFGAEVLHYSANGFAHTFPRITAGAFFQLGSRPGL